jgi:tetratricopeptide (TPR) repeat protein
VRSPSWHVPVRIGSALAALLLAACLAPGAFAGGGNEEASSASPCAAARALREAERPNAAEAAFFEALKTKGGVACGTTGLKRLGTISAGACKKAKALQKAGQEEKAEDSYSKVLEADPEANCATEGLEELRNDEDFWDRLGAFVKHTEEFLALLAIAATAYLLFTNAVVQIVTRPRWLRRFELIQWLILSGLEVEAPDDGPMKKGTGLQVASLIREQITPTRQGGLVSGYADVGEDLKSIADASSSAKIVFALLYLVAPRRRQRFKVSCTLQPANQDGRGTGISLELTCEKKLIAANTLWAAEFGNKSTEEATLHNLTAPAAGWIEHHVARTLQTDSDLLSVDSRSWALFKAARARKLSRDDAGAIIHYLHALRRDPGNVGALNNLALLAMNNREFEKAERLLTKAFERLPERPGRRWERGRRLAGKVANEQIWFTAHYNLAALHANWADSCLDADEECNPHRKHAHGLARDSALAAAKKLNRYGLLWRRRERRLRLKGRALAPALLIYAGSFHLENEGSNHRVGPRLVWAWRLKCGWVSPAQAFALAERLAGKAGTTDIPDVDEIRNMFPYLLAGARTHRGELTKAAKILRAELEKWEDAKAKSDYAKRALADPALDRLLTDSDYADLKAELEAAKQG